MGPEDKIDMQEEEPEPVTETVIPGLDITEAEQSTKAEKQAVKKTPYQKPIPKKFQAIWNDAGNVDEELDDEKDKSNNFTKKFERIDRIYKRIFIMELSLYFYSTKYFTSQTR